MNRFRQVVQYAWKQSKDLASEAHQSRLSLFFDMIRCYQKFRMWTNQYIKEKFYEKSPQERNLIGPDYLEKGKVRDAWQKDFRENRKFLIKYSNIKYEKASLREKRNKAYTKRYHAGKNLFVEYDVNISRQHYLEGTISIGDNVLFAKHVFIDYSGDLIIHDNVKISDGVSIETHSHPGFTSLATGSSKKEKLEIFEFVNLGAKSIITESCHKIGRYAKIGAGAVIRCNIPPYAIVVGNPAKIIGFIFSPEDMIEFEKSHYPESERTSLEKYTTLYLKYYKNRLNSIKEYHKL
jgi:acetyltransferase-like isoleucine patch superfamily enzyme